MLADRKKTGLVRKYAITKFLRRFVRSVVQNLNRNHARLLVRSVTGAKDPIIWKKCAVQRNSQRTLWRLGQKLMKLKNVPSIIPFYWMF